MSLNTAVTDVAWSPNYTKGRTRPIRRIDIHHWGDDNTTNHDAVVRILHTENAGGAASAHYVVSDGRVTQLVHDYDTAWHNRGNNSDSIGIECHPHCRPGDFQTVAKLIAAIRDQLGWLPLAGHKDRFPTACPGRYYDRLEELSDLADEINSHPSAKRVDPPAPPKKKVRKSDMILIYCDDLPGGRRFALSGSHYWNEWIDPDMAYTNAIAKQIGGDAARVTPDKWEHDKRAALMGTNMLGMLQFTIHGVLSSLLRHVQHVFPEKKGK